MYILKLIGPKGTNRLYSVHSLDILNLIGPEGTNRLHSVHSLDILKVIGPEGTDRLYSVYSLDCMLRTLSILDWNDLVFLKIFLNVYFFFRHIL